MTNNIPVTLALRSDKMQQAVMDTLKDPGRAADFTTSLISAVNGNPLLQQCDPKELMQTALKATSMKLPIDPSLGLAYIIPYNNNKKITDPDGSTRWVKKYEPQLQVGWKGFVELALRTQQYRTLHVTDVREGEYKGVDRAKGEYQFDWIENDKERNKLKVIGYLGYIELLSGYSKQLYMTVEDLTAHGKKYSQTFKKGFGLWAEDFHTMAMKTMIKLLIGKWGLKSTDIKAALRSDQAAMRGEDDFNYVDNPKLPEGVDTPAPDEQSQEPEEGEVIDRSGGESERK